MWAVRLHGQRAEALRQAAAFVRGIASTSGGSSTSGALGSSASAAASTANAAAAGGKAKATKAHAVSSDRAPSTRAALPPTARLLYRSLLRVAQRFDRMPAMKAALVHPACAGLEIAQEQADEAKKMGADMHEALQRHLQRTEKNEPPWLPLPTHGRPHPSLHSGSMADSNESPFTTIHTSISEQWARTINGKDAALSQKLFFRWTDRFFRRKMVPLVIDQPRPGAKRSSSAAAAAAKPDETPSARALAMPSPAGTVIPFYYLPECSVVASVRKEFRALTRVPTAAQWPHLLTGGFQALRFLHEHEKTLQETQLLDQLERLSLPSIGTRPPADATPQSEDARLAPQSCIDPALSFSPFGPPFYPPGSEELHTTLLGRADDQGAEEEHSVHGVEDADQEEVKGLTDAVARAAREHRQQQEQWEADLDAVQADIKKEQADAAAAATAAAEAPAAATPAAASVANPIAAAVTPASTAAAVLSLPTPPLPSVPPALARSWGLRPTRHLRAGSFLVSHPALSTPEFHQSVMLITRFDRDADVVEAVLLNRPMDAETLRQRSQGEADRVAHAKAAMAGFAAGSAEAQRQQHKMQAKSALGAATLPPSSPAALAAAREREQALAADPASWRHRYGQYWDVAALDARFPNASMYGGPVLRPQDDEDAPLVLHRRRDWQSGMGGSVALQRLAAKQRPLIPAVMGPRGPDGKAEELAPPVYIANLKQWTPFLSWTGTGTEAGLAAEPAEDDLAAETGDAATVPPLPPAAGSDAAAIAAASVAPWPASVLGKMDLPEWGRAPPSRTVVELPPLPPSTFATAAAAAAAPATAATPALPSADSTAAASPASTDGGASTAASTVPAASSAPTAASIATPGIGALSHAVPVSALRAWDFLLFFGCSTWTPRALAEEVEEGTWFLMEGNAHHIFTQHLDVEAGTRPAEDAAQGLGHDQEAEERELEKELAEELQLDAQQQADALAASAPAADSGTDAHADSSASSAAAPAVASPEEVKRLEEEMRAVVRELEEATAPRLRGITEEEAKAQAQQQAKASSASAASGAAPSAPAEPEYEQVSLLTLLRENPTPEILSRAQALRRRIQDAAIALMDAKGESERAAELRRAQLHWSVLDKALLAMARADADADAQGKGQTEGGVEGEASEKDDPSPSALGPLPPGTDVSELAGSVVSLLLHQHREQEHAELIERALLEEEGRMERYPDPLPNQLQRGFSTPVVPQAVWAAVMAQQQQQQQLQLQSAAADSSAAAEPATAADAASESSESTSALAIPAAAAAGAPALLPTSLPPVLFPWQRLWHHAMFQLGGEARHWAFLPDVPFELEQPVDHDENDDDDDGFDDDEDGDDDWDDGEEDH